MDEITIYFDGGVHNKRVAVVDVGAEDRVRVWEHVHTHSNTHGKISNELEHIGLLKALEYVYEKYGPSAENVSIYGDNQVVHLVEDNYLYGVPYLARLRKMCKRRLEKFHNPPELKWVPRSKNLAGYVLEMMYKTDLRLKRSNSNKNRWLVS